MIFVGENFSGDQGIDDEDEPDGQRPPLEGHDTITPAPIPFPDGEERPPLPDGIEEPEILTPEETEEFQEYIREVIRANKYCRECDNSPCICVPEIGPDSGIEPNKPNVVPSGTLTIKNRTGLKRKSRSHLVPRDRPKLKQLTVGDIDNLSEFKILRFAILNGYFKDKSSRTKKVSAEQLRQYLRNLANSSSGFKFNIPKKYRRRTVNAMLGEIPFKNLLLWCNHADNFKQAGLCLCMAFPGGDCEEEDPKGEIIKLIGERCKECPGIYSVWTFVDPVAKADGDQ